MNINGDFMHFRLPGGGSSPCAHSRGRRSDRELLGSGLKLPKVTTAENGKLAIVQGGDIRGAWQAADECHFSKEVAGSQLDPAVSDGDLNLAIDDEVNRISFVASPNYSLTRLSRAWLEVKHEHLALLRAEVFEKWEAIDQLFRREGLVGGCFFFSLPPCGVQTFFEGREAGTACIFRIVSSAGGWSARVESGDQRP